MEKYFAALVFSSTNLQPQEPKYSLNAYAVLDSGITQLNSFSGEQTAPGIVGSVELVEGTIKITGDNKLCANWGGQNSFVLAHPSEAIIYEEVDVISGRALFAEKNRNSLVKGLAASSAATLDWLKRHGIEIQSAKPDPNEDTIEEIP